MRKEASLRNNAPAAQKQHPKPMNNAMSSSVTPRKQNGNGPLAAQNQNAPKDQMSVLAREGGQRPCFQTKLGAKSQEKTQRMIPQSQRVQKPWGIAPPAKQKSNISMTIEGLGSDSSTNCESLDLKKRDSLWESDFSDSNPAPRKQVIYSQTNKKTPGVASCHAL